MNRMLGEIEVEIGGTKYTLRPTFEAIVEMESLTGLTLAALFNRYLALSLGLKDVTAIIYSGIRGATGKDPGISFNDLGASILNHGMSKLMAKCGLLLGAAYTGKPIDELEAPKISEDEKKKEEGVEQKK